MTLRLVVAVLLCLGLASCGGEEGAGRAQYLSPQSDVVMSLSLDYDGEDWEAIRQLYADAARSGLIDDIFGVQGMPVPETLDEALEELAGFAGLSFESDVKPLLGGQVRIGLTVEPAPALPAEARELLERLDRDATRFDRDEPTYYDRDGNVLSREGVEHALDLRDRYRPRFVWVVTYEAPDAGALERTLRKWVGPSRAIEGVESAVKYESGLAVVGGDTIVWVVDIAGDPDPALRRVLRTEEPGAPLPPGEDHLLSLRATPGALGSVLDDEELRRALEESSAGRALRGATAALDVDEDGLSATATIDFEGLDDEELPLGPPGPLALPSGEAIASAASDQQHTTVFLERLARELFPDSLFIRRAQQFERREGIRFADEVLRAFSGPSATVLRPGAGGEEAFAARSALADPERMRALLPKLAPALPDILEGLQGLGGVGLSALLFAAPDAPLTPMAASILAAIRVTPLPPTADAQLYEVRGLDPRNREPLPDSLVYGMVGDVFVVGSTRELAEEAARLPTEDAEDAGARMVVDVERLLERADPDGEARSVAGVLSSAEVEASARDGDVVAQARVEFAR